MAHPHFCGLRQALPQGRSGSQRKLGRTVFTGLRAGKTSAKTISDKLHAVADTENRHSKFKKSPVQHRSVLAANAGRSARKNDGLRLHGCHFRGLHCAGMNFRVNAGFTYTARYQLRHLRAVVYDDNLIGHMASLLQKRSAAVKPRGAGYTLVVNPVVRRFLRDDNVMDVTFTQAGRRDFAE